MTIKKQQQIFIQKLWAQGAAPQDFLQLKLTAQSQHNFSIYQESLFGRVTQTLAANLFYRVSNVFGIELVEEILSEYFRQHPASHWNLEHCCLKLPEFVQNLEPTEKHRVLVDLFETCLLRHALLCGPDPAEHKYLIADSQKANTEENLSPALNLLYLKKPHFILQQRSANCDLFELWNSNSSDTLVENSFVNTKSSTLYFQKISALEIFCISVSPLMLPFMNDLTGNENQIPKSVLEAMESLNNFENCEQEFQNLISVLTQNNAFNRQNETEYLSVQKPLTQ